MHGKNHFKFIMSVFKKILDVFMPSTSGHSYKTHKGLCQYSVREGKGKKVKQFRYRPRVAQRVPDFMTTAHDGGKVVSFTHQLPLSPVNTPGIHFC